MEPTKAKSTFSSVIRIVLTLLSFLCLPIGINLSESANLPEYIAGGESEALGISGGIITTIASIVLIVCIIIWVISFIRSRREARFSKTIAGLLGRTSGWALLGGVIMTLAFTFLAPVARGAIVEEITARGQELFDLFTKDFEFNPLEDLLENYQSMTDDEINQRIDDATFSRIDFGTDASSNKTSNLLQNSWSQNAYAVTSDIVILNKAKLSSDGHFVVFYTDTGDEKISDDKATKLGEMAENIIRSYKTNLGLDYLYEKLESRSKNYQKVQAVLRNNGIDENALDTAMPIYVAEPFSDPNDSTLAFYAPHRFDDLLWKVATNLMGMTNIDLKARLVMSTPTLPFIVVRPQNVDATDLPLVTAHEIGHHYADLICEQRNASCSLNNFIDETIANYFAVNVISNEEQPADNITNGHHGVYVKHGTCYKIGDVLPEPTGEVCHKQGSFPGYPQYAFLQNYVDIVPDGQNKILDALPSDDALTLLYEKATPEYFAKVMTTLSQRNLTNDYKKKSLIVDSLPTGETLPCKLCTESYIVHPAAMRYFYLPKETYAGYKIRMYASPGLRMSMLGLNDSGKYELIEEADEIDFDYDEDSKYSQIAIAVVNTSISEDKTLVFSLNPEDSDDLKETNALEDYLSGLDVKVSSDCIEMTASDLADTMQKIMGIVGIFTNDENAASDFAEDADNIKTSLAGRRIKICQRELKDSASIASAKKLIKRIFPNSFTFTEDNTVGTYLDYNLLTGEANIAAALAVDDDVLIYLVTIK